jgi:hypothetical protein
VGPFGLRERVSGVYTMFTRCCGRSLGNPNDVFALGVAELGKEPCGQKHGLNSKDRLLRLTYHIPQKTMSAILPTSSNHSRKTICLAGRRRFSGWPFPVLR